MSVLSDPNLTEYILASSDFKTILNYCKSHQEARHICQSETFWSRRAQEKFGTTVDKFRQTELSPIQRYVELGTEAGGVTEGSERFIGHNEFAERALIHGDQELFDYILSVVPGEYKWDILIEIPNSINDVKLFDHVLSVAPENLDWNYLAASAIYKNDKETFTKIRLKAPEYYIWNWRYLLIIAEDESMYDYIKSLSSANYH